MIGTVLGSTMLLMGILSVLIILSTRQKYIKHKDEIRIGSIGALWFFYISWACVYMAQYRAVYIRE